MTLLESSGLLTPTETYHGERRKIPPQAAGTLIAVAALLSSGCMMKQKQMNAGTFEGPPTVVCQGEARTFITLDDGKPVTLGILLSEAALNGLPADGHDVAYELELPREARGTGYTHVVVDWNPHGHVPPGVYDRPHFDFHFYTMTSEKRQTITAVGDDLARAHKAPPAEYMPAGYILPPGTEVPAMGAHAIDPKGYEFTKHDFTKTFIYGFYDGEMVFVEPMVTKAYLESKPNDQVAIAVPQKYPQCGYYPTSYGVVYDKGERAYEISLDGLVLR